MEIHSEFLDALTPSSIRSITAKIRDKASEGIQVISFAGGLPSKEFFPIEDIRKINDQIFDEEGGDSIQYAASDGYDPLRKYLVEFMKRYQVTDIDYKNILITSGAQQGLAYLSKGLITPGSVVVVEGTSYPGALDTFRAYGASIVGVEMDGDGMRMDRLETVLRENQGKVPFIYTIADFQNPTGCSMSLERRKQLVELAEKYDTFVVEDGPYSLISFNGEVMPAIKSFDRYGRVIYSGSTSKTIAPGLRIGWLIADHASIQKLVYLKMRDDLQVNNIAQRQVYHYMKDCDFDGHLRMVTDVYRRRRDVMAKAVKESFPAGTKLLLPGGGLFMWVELPEKADTLEMFDYVFQKNIAYVPGVFFRPDGSGKNTMRLNFSTTSEETIQKSIPILGEMICQYLETHA
ncbi:PLP-dependent aminotransferase family protein [uncultured Dysosmobacter sp.]|uniref:aminotransferase-like domain-containing protein n=1 Tax=uncultured Dysosmobacter sp. TaxID=2591384 RepID=UPI002628ECAC|nr:PLP-dependent aminotransferase family protein [uncultured Dysosmobacter sp.]